MSEDNVREKFRELLKTTTPEKLSEAWEYAVGRLSFKLAMECLVDHVPKEEYDKIDRKITFINLLIKREEERKQLKEGKINGKM